MDEVDYLFIVSFFLRVIHCLIIIKKSTISIILPSYTTIPHENKKKDKSKNSF